MLQGSSGLGPGLGVWLGQSWEPPFCVGFLKNHQFCSWIKIRIRAVKPFGHRGVDVCCRLRTPLGGQGQAWGAPSGLREHLLPAALGCASPLLLSGAAWAPVLTWGGSGTDPTLFRVARVKVLPGLGVAWAPGMPGRELGGARATAGAQQHPGSGGCMGAKRGCPVRAAHPWARLGDGRRVSPYPVPSRHRRAHPSLGRAREGAEGAPRGGGEQGEPQLGAGGLGTVGCSSPSPRSSQTLQPPKWSRCTPPAPGRPPSVFPQASALGALDQDSLVSGTHRSQRKERDAIRFCKCCPGEQNPPPPSWCRGARGLLGPVTLTPSGSGAALQLIAALSFCYNKIPVKDLFKIPRYALGSYAGL